MVTSRLDVALAHAALGFKVFPLHHVTRSGDCSCQAGADCGSKGKHPRFDGWQAAATTDPEQIRRWWTTRPAANIGIATGAPSGAWVLDTDPRHGGDETLAALEAKHGALPHTVETITGSVGRHIWFTMPEGDLPNEVAFAPGLDVRSTGGLVVAAGSNHTSGRTYEWDAEHHPAETPLAAAPEWLLRLIRAAAAPPAAQGASAAVPEKFPHGTQYKTLLRFAGKMRQGGASEREIDAALQVMNRERCERPGTPEEIRKLAASICRYPAGALELHREPPDGDGEPQASPAEPVTRVTGALPGAGALTRRLADIEPEAVRWLWPGRVPLGKITILDGDPGLGKSLLTLNLAARVSAGDPMPDGTSSELDGPAGVILMTGEDGLADTVKPRLVAAGADCARVVALEGISSPREGAEPLVTQAWLTDLEVLEEVIARITARLLVVDPLMAFIPTAFDSHNDQQVRAVLTGLVALANRTGCAILLVRHLNKSPGGNPLYRGGGSIGIVGAARSGLLVAPDPRDEERLRRVLASTKSNLAAPPSSLAFRVEANGAGVPFVCWDGTADMDAGELLGASRPLGETAAAVLDAFVMDGEEVTPLEMALRLKRDPKAIKLVMWRLSQRGLLANHGGKYSRSGGAGGK